MGNKLSSVNTKNPASNNQTPSTSLPESADSEPTPPPFVPVFRWQPVDVSSYDFSVTGIRPQNEDAHIALLELPICTEYSFWAVYDGHNGLAASTYLGEHFHVQLDENLAQMKGEDVKRSLTQAEVHYTIIKTFCSIDDSFLNTTQDSG